MTCVVENDDEIYEIAKNERYQVVGESSDTLYGQRRLLPKGPNGMIVDVSLPIPNFEPKIENGLQQRI